MTAGVSFGCRCECPPGHPLRLHPMISRRRRDHDDPHVVHARAAGLDVRKMAVTATVRLCVGSGEPVCESRGFSALPRGLDDLVSWLVCHGVEAAAMEGTGVYWRTPWERLTGAGIEVERLHAQHVKQSMAARPTLPTVSRWPASQSFSLCRESMVPPRAFRSLRKVSRMRRQVVRERARNRIHKILDASGVRVSGILSDLFGANGMRILKGPGRERAARDDPGLADQPCDVLTACSLFLLRDQLDAFDDATRRLEHYDEVINDGLAEHQDQIDLMMTIPGIIRAAPSSSRSDPTSPCSPHDAGLPRGRACIPATTKAPANGTRAEPGAATPHCARSSSNVPGVPHGPGTVSSRAYHKDLAVRRGYCKASVATADAARHLQRVEEYRVLPRPRPRGGHGPTQCSTLDHDAEEIQHRSRDMVQPNPDRCLRNIPGRGTHSRPERAINTIVKPKTGAGP